MSTARVATASRYAVVGNPVAHSQSPFIHAAIAVQTGELITYDRLLCPLDGFAAAAREFAAGGASGCNVTMPFKFEAFMLAARRTARAEIAGACNVLRFDRDGWFGDNTDGAGLVRDIERNAGVALREARVLLIGAGGGAAGALGALVAAGTAEVVVANRTVERARELVARHRAALADGVPGRVVATTLDRCGTAFDVVVNASAEKCERRGGASRADCPRPRRARSRHDVRAARRRVSRLGRVAWRARPRRSRHAGRAGGGSVHSLARPRTRDRAGPGRVAPSPGGRVMRVSGRPIGRQIALLLVCFCALQLYFVARIVVMRVVDPQSTTFQRSEEWRLAVAPDAHAWRQRWVDYAALPASLKRAVIAAEDSGFTEHSGVEWDALEKAWERNDRADAAAAQAAARAQRRDAARPAAAPVAAAGWSWR